MFITMGPLAKKKNSRERKERKKKQMLTTEWSTEWNTWIRGTNDSNRGIRFTLFTDDGFHFFFFFFFYHLFFLSVFLSHARSVSICIFIAIVALDVDTHAIFALEASHFTEVALAARSVTLCFSVCTLQISYHYNAWHTHTNIHTAMQICLNVSFSSFHLKVGSFRSFLLFISPVL